MLVTSRCPQGALLALAVVLCGAAPASRTPTLADLRQHLRDADQRLVAAMRAELQDASACPHDLRLCVAARGREPERLIALVRDEIRYEAYPGLLRGPVGTLLAGSGNALDKSALLAELLRLAGHEARIRAGTISTAAAAQLVARAAASVPRAPGAPARGPRAGGVRTVDEAGVRRLSARIGVDADAILPLLRAGEAEAGRAWDDVLQTTEREVLWLDRMVPLAATAARPLAPALLEAARAHAVVEWRPAGEDAWREVESCGLDRDGASPFADAPVVLDPRRDAVEFTVALVLERTVDGTPEAVPLLQHAVPVHETWSRPLTFTIDPVGASTSPEPGTDAGPVGLARHLRSLRRFQAQLGFGTERFGSRVFDLDGSVFTVAADGGLWSIGGSLERGLQRVADALSAGPEAERKVTAKSLRLELAARSRGTILWQQQRVLLAEGGEADWCPIVSWNLHFMAGRVPASYVRAMQLESRVANQAVFAALSAWQESGDPRGLAAVGAARAQSWPVELATMLAQRTAFAASLAAAGEREPVLWFTAPDLWVAGRQVRLHGDHAVCLCHGIDIVHDGALVLQSDGQGFALDRAATRRLGAFDTVLEEAQVAAANATEPARGAVRVFERARLGGGTVTALAAGDRDGLTRAGLGAADRTWLERHALPGQQLLVAVLGEAGCCAETAWWECEPATGRVLGRITGGRGGCVAELALPQDLAEHCYLVSRAAGLSLCFVNILANLAMGHVGHAATEAAICALMAGYGHAMHVIGGSYAAATFFELVDILFGLKAMNDMANH